jgi:UDP-N-acetylglucosamine 4,6-dehydratase
MDTVNEKILVFGGTGSLGQALIRRLSEKNELVLFSRDEAKHWTIRNNLTPSQNVKFIVGDIRDNDRVARAILISQPTVIILASALKQVDTCENSPFESVQTNVLGIRNVTESVLTLSGKIQDLHSVLMVSTDKACAPTNVYGMSKAIAERIVTSAFKYSHGPKFVGVRYGNVLESRGSVIPLFKHQVENQENITVTHRDMTRFIMTLDQSIDLIESTLNGSIHGEIWLPKLNSMKILDLAEIFAEKFKKPIIITGIRPGEKIHEDLISEPESIRVRLEDGFYKMTSVLSEPKENANVFSYSSSNDLLAKNKLEEYLESLGIFSRPLNQFLGRVIEEIDTKKTGKK